MSNPPPPAVSNVHNFVLSKSKTTSTTLKATVHSYLNNFSVSIHDDNPGPGIPPLSISNADSFACSVLITNSGGDIVRKPLTPISDYISENRITFDLNPNPLFDGPLSSHFNGLTDGDVKAIDNTHKTKSNDHTIFYDFNNGNSYTVKVSLSINPLSANAVDHYCTFKIKYYSEVPTVNPYSITQVNSSTDFLISNLLFLNCPLISDAVPIYNQLPYVITMTFDEIDGTGDTDETFSAHLIMDSAGRGVVDSNGCVLSPLINMPLPTGQYTVATKNENNGRYVVKTSLINDIGYDFKPNTGYMTTVSSSYGDGVYIDPFTDKGVKIWNLNPVVIVGVSCLDATAPYGDSADREDLEQPLMSVILQSYLNAPDNEPYWGSYTPSTVTFKLVLTQGPRAGETFEYTTIYLPTTGDGLNPSYDISLYDMSKNVSYDLQNGVTYDLTVTVNWVAPTPSSPVNPLDMTEATSRSAVYVDAKFTQTVDPVLELKACNAWEAMSLYLPETISASMPKTGVVLSCRKSNQFGVAGTDDLDAQSAGTKFKVEYRVGLNGDWNSVARGSITQPASIAGDVNSNIRKASSEVVGVTVVDITDGLFSLPASLGGLGTSQPPLYFYLPDVGSDFDESKTERVYFRVAIVTEIDSYYTPKISTYKTESLFIIDRPVEYSWSSPSNTLLEPFINPLETFLDLSDKIVPVTQNGVLYNFPLSGVVADSNLPMVSSDERGWAVKNPAAVNGVVPKVNLYFWNKNIASSTASTNVTLNDLSGSGLGMYALLVNNANLGAKQLPFFVLYTDVDAVTSNKASWYKSKAMFAPAPSVIPSDPSMEGLLLLYTGTLPANIPYAIPAHRCVKCNYSPSYSNANINFMNEKINLASIQTSSNASSTSAGDFNFNLRATGMDGVVGGNPFNSFMNFGLTHSFPLQTSEDSIYLAGSTITSTNPAFGYYNAVTTSLSINNLRIPVELGTTMNYAIAKLYDNQNTNSSGTYLSSKTSISYPIASKGMPTIADYKVANTLASNSAGILYLYDNVTNSFVFDLTIACISLTTRRIAGVDLFVTDKNSNLVKIANYEVADYATKTSVVASLPADLLANLISGATHTVTFKPYRDPHVVTEVEHLYSLPADYVVTSFVYLPSSPTANNVPVEYSWVAGAENEPRMTFNNSGLQLVLPLNNTQSNHYAGATLNWGYNSAMGNTLNLSASDALDSIEVTPGSQVSYTVQHLYTDAFGVVQPGSVSSVYAVDCLSMPTKADYAVANTLANDSAGILYLYDNVTNSFVFDLTIVSASSTRRVDGVDLFVIDNTGILKQVANYDATNYATMQNVVTLLSSSLNALSLTHSSTYTVVIKPYRDDNVESEVDHLYPDPTEWSLTTFVYLPSSLTADNVPVEYSWVVGAANEPYMTFNAGLQLVLLLNNTQSNYYAGATIMWGYSPSTMGTAINLLASDSSTSIEVAPGSQVSYTVQYNYTDAFGVVQPGSVSDVYAVACLNMPTNADYTIDLVSNLSGSTPTLNGNGNISYNTVNDNGKSSIMFNLAFNQLSTDRIDGVHVYFTSSDSNMVSLQLGSYLVAQAGDKEISLASISGWNNYASATITFVPFRDAHVVSAVAQTENNAVGAVTSAFSIWNVPVLSQPSEGGSSIVLNGGIISGNVNTSYTTSIEWTKDATQDFTYKVTLSGYTDGNGGLINIPTTGASLLTAVLPISDTSVANYTVLVTKIFKGHSSGEDTVVFSSSVVDPSVMAISVLVPSGVASLKVSWVTEYVVGNAIIVSRYIKDTVSSSTLVAYSVGATRLEQSSKVYNLSALGSNFSIGKTLNLVMSVSAKVSYTLNAANVANGSSTVVLVNGPMTKYTVSTVPHVSLTTSPSTVLIQGATSSPSLLMNLDAKGLEAEGFISLVLVLTQDGTDSNPGGSEVLLQFPASPSSQPFSFLNNVGTSTGNLVAGTQYSATPLTEAPTGLSNSTVGPYVLTIGSQPSGNSTPPNPNPNGFSLSSLTFPQGSGFETDPANLVNVMAILTSRRGTDIMVGSFEYVMPPVASAVSITSNNGNYYVNFTLS